jgi:Protein of unknown function (DUF3040)
MSLPASQQRVLDRIEETLKRREPRLASMFAIFTRLTVHEEVPRTEALVPVPWWSAKRYQAPARVRAAVFLTLAVVLVVAGVFLGMSQSRAGCAGPIVVRGPLTESTQVRNCLTAPQAKGYGHGP